jgi:hypothetical protein
VVVDGRAQSVGQEARLGQDSRKKLGIDREPLAQGESFGLGAQA